MTIPSIAPCDSNEGTPLAETFQPDCQLPAETGVTVTVELRLIASLLARLSVAYSSKPAFFTRWLWASDLKLGKAIVASMPTIVITMSSSVSVKPADVAETDVPEANVKEGFMSIAYQWVTAPCVLAPVSSSVRVPSFACLLPATGVAVTV